MAVATVKEKWTGKVHKIVIGQEPSVVRAGGAGTLPFLLFEGLMPNKPVVALEVYDMTPGDWPEVLSAPFAGVIGDPVAWANKCIEYGADMVCLRLESAHPDNMGTLPDKAAATARAVAEAVNVPLIVVGCGYEEKDGEIMAAVAEALAGKNALLGCATVNNYKTFTAACMVNGHSIIASTPLDINLAKQLNILINEMGLPLDRIAMDPLVGPLGYGLEYAYSIMERARLGALTGDKMLAMPVICFAGQEVWKTREARTEDNEEWGLQAQRAVMWELVTATSLAQAGGDIMVLRHPESLRHFKKHIEAMMKTN